MHIDAQLKTKTKNIFWGKRFTLDKILNKYGNILIAGNLNKNINNDRKDTNHNLCEIIHTFSLSSLTNLKNWYKSMHVSTLGNMLTNGPKRSQKTSTVETRISYCHKMVVTILKNFPLKA